MLLAESSFDSSFLLPSSNVLLNHWHTVSPIMQSPLLSLKVATSWNCSPRSRVAGVEERLLL